MKLHGNTFKFSTTHTEVDRTFPAFSSFHYEKNDFIENNSVLGTPRNVLGTVANAPRTTHPKGPAEGRTPSCQMNHVFKKH